MKKQVTMDKEFCNMEKIVSKTACKSKSVPAGVPSSSSTTKNRMEAADRKVSTGTLNRLILVAQALESEVETRRNDDISAIKITFSIRVANTILLLLINILIFSGFGKYQVQKDGRYQDLMLTADKWTYDSSNDELPETFVYLRLSGQYLSACITVFLLFSTIFLQLLHLCGISISRITNMCYSFGAVPFTLFVFGLEMHYSTCPWLDEYFISYSMSDMSSQCAINGWALAGIFSLLSCGLFVSEGIITAFFGNSHATENKETIV
ncbi:hypothetical protein CAEBREN_05614 [Caenorhabditis brenneri]|uniref:Uncharacterized protein n=1 Tax=Caenorhabditis brenneri TaxID=135651 RepID=G0MSK4_CAEBE|nr:hypothetical protein CAEBREN_05614 [Caenorhabditis brenneri]